MADLIQLYSEPYEGADGVVYNIRACGEGTADGAWEGWLEFHPIDQTLPFLRTRREAYQPTRFAIARWASGLDRAAFDGAFRRMSAMARPRQPQLGIRNRIA